MSKVSVIIPVYNVELYLEKCLDSLINQTLKDIEIICINDCSTDNSLNILEQFKNKDERIKLINLKENKGAAIARNEGLKIAKGEYLGFVDPDDYVDLNFYEELYKKAKQDDADIVKACIRTYLDGGLSVKSKLNDVINKTKNNFTFTHEWTSAIYRKYLIIENNIVFLSDYSMFEDIAFLTDFLIHSKKLSICNCVNYNYVKRKNSLDSNNYDCNKAARSLEILNIILLKLQDAYNKKIIAKEEFICAYVAKLNLFVHIFLQCSTEDAGLLCINNLLNKYEEFSYKDEIYKYFAYNYILDDVKSKNSSEIVKKLKNCNKASNTKELLCLLRKKMQNIKD